MLYRIKEISSQATINRQRPTGQMNSSNSPTRHRSSCTRNSRHAGIPVKRITRCSTLFIYFIKRDGLVFLFFAKKVIYYGLFLVE